MYCSVSVLLEISSFHYKIQNGNQMENKFFSHYVNMYFFLIFRSIISLRSIFYPPESSCIFYLITLPSTTIMDAQHYPKFIYNVILALKKFPMYFIYVI